eukprot:TRINITY_DN17738_c0_g1_i1.p1 TRINITY_DN17738_c0_g1~~TRINITY_DN17738_c0_g1_i1.p1  ORF type:complete len:353 (+),score=62.45 TRINITY_DN17738_c0_g1_i1:109-1167(+)
MEDFLFVGGIAFVAIGIGLGCIIFVWMFSNAIGDDRDSVREPNFREPAVPLAHGAHPPMGPGPQGPYPWPSGPPPPNAAAGGMPWHGPPQQGPPQALCGAQASSSRQSAGGWQGGYGQYSQQYQWSSSTAAGAPGWSGRYPQDFPAPPWSQQPRPGGAQPPRAPPTEAAMQRAQPFDEALRESTAKFNAAMANATGAATVTITPRFSVEMTQQGPPTAPAPQVTPGWPTPPPAPPPRPMGEGGPPRLSSNSGAALSQLGASDARLSDLESRTARIEQEYVSGILSASAARSMLAQIEAQAKELESRGVDSVATGNLNSGRQMAKDSKRQQLQRLESLFARLDLLFGRLPPNR